MSTKDVVEKVVIEGATEGAAPAMPFATFADLCEPARVVDKVFPGLGANGMRIRYRPSIPLDRLLQIQSKHNMIGGGRGQRDSRGFMVSILKEVLINPRVETVEQERWLLKANSTVLTSILGDVLGQDEDSFKAVVEDLVPSS